MAFPVTINGNTYTQAMFDDTGYVTAFPNIFSDLAAVAAGIAATAAAGGIPPNGQLAFPATQNPSSNANTLDDYEEGTFALTIAFGGAAVGVTYSANTIAYVKVGKKVTVTGKFALSSKGSSTGTAVLSGLPFAAAVSGTHMCVSIHALNMNTITVDPVAQIVNGVATFTLKAQLADADLDNTHFSNTSELRFSFTYLSAN
jgi:hypothetical protein